MFYFRLRAGREVLDRGKEGFLFVVVIFLEHVLLRLVDKSVVEVDTRCCYVVYVWYYDRIQ